MGLLKKLHDMALEDDGNDKASASAPAPAKAPGFANIPAPGGSFPNPGSSTGFPTASPFAVPSSVVPDEGIYQRVLAKTDFDQTEVGKTIHKYFDALEGTPLDINTKFKTALAQAAKLDALSPDKVLAAFDTLKAALQAESDKFGRAVDAQNQKEVVGRQQQLQQIIDQVAQLNQQIADLQTKHNQISAELVDAQGKVGNAQTQFQLATQRRSNEIDQQKAQFAALLK